uniref:Uncharacterized protein n=1 Tax=Anopheles funestus TaxID=62324 RepID=A0A4Y0BGG0_ANOFN
MKNCFVVITMLVTIFLTMLSTEGHPTGKARKAGNAVTKEWIALTNSTPTFSTPTGSTVTRSLAGTKATQAATKPPPTPNTFRTTTKKTPRG